ncbi:MAG TPA: FAD-dependent oxidoreductase [Gemmatimonadales bacterium]
MHPDFLIIGGGIMGVSLALEVKRRHGDARVVLIEKEPACGLHASGRNSGVLHAGFYYTADSLKARFTADGNRELTEYCLARGLPINRCGKLVVARNQAELGGLDELARRASVNGVRLESISAEDARKIEPRVKTWERALFSPTTSSVDPRAVMVALCDDARAAGVSIRTGVAYLGRRGGSGRGGRGGSGAIRTSSGDLTVGYVINAAGLYADRIARDFGFSADYRILPFKGVYVYAEDGEALRTNVYPVPDLRHPFLGVHFTVRADGRVKIGPSAIPAFWREHYGGLASFHVGECAEIVWREAGLLLRNDFDFRRLAAAEIRKYSRRHLVGLAAELISGVDARRYRRWGEPGIRAQLLNIREHRLEMDFRFEGDDRSFHVLNAVSPAFTCAGPFGRYLVDRVGELVR